MMLYSVNDATDLSLVIAYMTSLFGANVDNTFSKHINGQQVANGTWFNYDPNPVELYSGAVPAYGTGGFLNIEGFGAAGWKTKAYTNSTTNWFICEFYV